MVRPIANMHLARVVVTKEPDANEKLNLQTLKALTGDTTINARAVAAAQPLSTRAASAHHPHTAAALSAAICVAEARGHGSYAYEFISAPAASRASDASGFQAPAASPSASAPAEAGTAVQGRVKVLQGVADQRSDAVQR